MIGEHVAPSKKINQEILTYKSNFLYSDQYKKCVRNGFYSTYLFNEPMACINENFIQSTVSYMGLKSTYSEMPDDLHILKKYAGSDLNMESISNKQGQIMLLAINISLDPSAVHGTMLEIVNKMSSKLGGALTYPTATNGYKPFSWITSDNYDITVNQSANGILIKYINRAAYAVFNKNKIRIPTF